LSRKSSNRELKKCNHGSPQTTKSSSVRSSSSSSLSSKKKKSDSDSHKDEKSHRKSSSKREEKSSSKREEKSNSKREERSNSKREEKSSSKREEKDLLRLELLKVKLEEASKIESALKEIEIDKIAKLNKIREQLVSEESDEENKKALFYKKIREKQKQNESLRKKNKSIQCSILKIRTNNPLKEDDYGYDKNEGAEEKPEKISAAEQMRMEERLKKLVENNRKIKTNLTKYRSNVNIMLQNCNNALQVYLSENKRKRMFQDCIDYIILNSKKLLKKKSFEKLIKDVLQEKKKCEQSPSNTQNHTYHIAAGAFLSFRDEIKIRGRNAAAKTIQRYVRGERKIVVKTNKKNRKSKGTTKKEKWKASLSSFMSTLPEDDDVCPSISDSASCTNTVFTSVSCADSIMSLRTPNEASGAVLIKFAKIDMDDVMSPRPESLESIETLDSDMKKGKKEKSIFKSKIAHSRKQLKKGLSMRMTSFKCPFGYNEKLIESDCSDDDMDFTEVMSLSSAQTAF